MAVEAGAVDDTAAVVEAGDAAGAAAEGMDAAARAAEAGTKKPFAADFRGSHR